METHFEKTLESQTVYEGRVITVTRDTALLEDGTTALRDVVHHHGGACILPYYEGAARRQAGSRRGPL